MRSGIIFLCCLIHGVVASAQHRDSVVLDSITVYGLPDEKYLTGSSLQLLDSAIKAQENSRHLGEILSLQFPIYFRSYGNGMLSSITMRGTSSQHTAVLWNGININSFSLGQADFSILPATAFEEVKVHEGGGSARYGSGAFGGSVLLNSSSHHEPNALTITQDIGSFGRFFTSLRGVVTLGNWNLTTKLYSLKSENDFPVLSTGERQQHAAFRQSGVLQDVVYRWSEAKALSIHYWYHDADREIQPPIGQYNSKDEQQDKNHRLSIQYKSNSPYGLFSVYGGYVDDVIVYNESKGEVTRFIGGVKHQVSFIKTLHTQFGVEWNHIIGRILNYQDGKAVEDRYDFTTSFQKNVSTRLSLALNLRQPVVTGFSAPFLPYFGFDYALIKSTVNALSLRGNVSKNYRIPTLNDRYWQNAGDQNLLPETSYAAETGLAWRYKNFEFENTWYVQQVDNWIQWVPKENGNYRPQNIKQVRAEGFEFKSSFHGNIGNVTIAPYVTYQFTKSVTTEAPANEQYVIGKQLIYTPLHTVTARVQLTWKKNYSSDISLQYSSKRYTDAANSDTYALPAFALVNISFGKFWSLRSHRIDLRGSAKNIFNLDYQLYAGRAMPGRNYNIQIIYQLNPKSK